jgi:hypothetical protein
MMSTVRQEENLLRSEAELKLDLVLFAFGPAALMTAD